VALLIEDIVFIHCADCIHAHIPQARTIAVKLTTQLVHCAARKGLLPSPAGTPSLDWEVLIMPSY
jgi:hypothetical protein